MMLKRMFSLILAAAMVVSMVPVQALAVETEKTVVETTAEVVETTEVITESTETTSAPTELVSETAAPEETVEESTAVTEEPVVVETASQEAADSVVDSGICGDDLTWVLDDKGTMTISGSGPMWNYLLGDSPWDKSKVVKAEIDSGVTSIGQSIFYAFKNLTSVTIPDSVTSIGESAFGYCSSLTSVVIPNSVTSIGPRAFSYCDSLTSVTISNSVTAIDTSTFYACKSLSSVTIPDGVTDIGSAAFYECASLTSVTIPNSVTDIGDGAFWGCSSLTGVVIPDSITSTRLGASAFRDCSGLTSVTIPNGLFNIDKETFYGCESLSCVTIPDGIFSIGPSAFSGCTGLISIQFEGNAPVMDPQAFENVTATCFYPADNDTWTAEVMRDYGGTLTWEPLTQRVFGSSITGGTCGDNLTWVLDSAGTLTISGTGKMADYDWDEAPWLVHSGLIKRVVIQEGVTSIGNRAFPRCSSMTSIEIPESVTEIRYAAFYGCSSLAAFTFPSGITKIAGSLFEGCSSLTEIVIPAEVTMVCGFAFQACSSLTKVTFTGSAPEFGETAFLGTTTTVYYPAGDSTWTADIRQDYNGTLTWVPYQIQYQPCPLSEMTDLDYMAFSVLAYENFRTGETVAQCLNRLGKWNKTWGAGITYAQLCGHIAGWKAILTRNLDTKNGFYAVAFRNADNEALIAYRGSVPLDEIDDYNSLDAAWDWLVSDLQLQILNIVESETQSKSAFLFYEDIRDSGSWDSIAVTGHSLGGGLANMVSARYRCKGVTMNAISVLDALYEAMPVEMGELFYGVDDWTFLDHANMYDVVAGMWEHYIAGDKLKPVTIHSSNYGLKDFVSCHGMSSYVKKDANGDPELRSINSTFIRNTVYSKSLDLVRHVNLGTTGGDTFSNGLGESNYEVSYGGKGNDRINAATGEDVLIGGQGGDTLDGGWGDDIYIYYKGDGVDSIKDTAGDDTLYLRGFDDSDKIRAYVETDSKYVYITYDGEVIVMIHREGRAYKSSTNDSFKIYAILEDNSIHSKDITNMFQTKAYGSRLIVGCPVNVEVLDAEGNVVFTLFDGEVGNWYNEYGNFYVYEEENGEYGKVLELVEGYTCRIVGVDSGTMDIDYQNVVDGELTEVKRFAEVPVETAFTATLEATNDGELVLAADTDGDNVVDAKIGYDGKVIPVERITLDREYLALKPGETAQLQAEVQPAALTEFLQWSVEDDSEIISVSETGEVTAQDVGTAYVLATVFDGENTMTARCRIDVAKVGEPEKIAIDGVQLGSNKLTSELYSTDYAQLEILLQLPQNYTAVQDPYSASQSAAMAQAGSGVAIESARFADETLNELFAISVLDDRRVAVVPTDNAVNNPKSVKSKYVSAIVVTVDGEEYTSEDLTLTVKQTKPKLKVSIPAFNSFYSGQTQKLTVTGGTVTEIRADESKSVAIPAWLTLEGETLALTEDAPLKNTSGKAYILVKTEEWRIPVAMTLSVKNTYKTPGLKLSATSVTMTAQAEDSNGVTLKLQCKNKKETLEDLQITGINAPEGYSVENFNVNDGSFLLKTKEDFKAGKIILNVEFANTKNPLPLTLTVKTSAVNLKLSKSSVTLNKAVLDGASVTVTATPADYNLDIQDYRLTDAKGNDKTDSGELDISVDGDQIRAAAHADTPTGTYKLYIRAGGSKEVVLTVKVISATPSVTFKAKGNLDHSFPENTVTVTPTFKNYNGSYTVIGMTAQNAKKEDATVFFAQEQKENTILLTCDEDTPVGTYTVTLPLRLEDGTEVPNTVKVTVKRTAVKLKLSASKLTLNKTIGDTGTVAVSCTTKGYAFTKPVWHLMDKSGKVSAEGQLDISWANGALAIATNDLTAYGGTYKLLVKANENAPAQTLAVTIFAENKSTVTVTLKAKGSIDVIRDGTSVVVTPTYKNLSAGTVREEKLVFYKTVGKTQTEVEGLFTYTENTNGTFTVTKAKGTALDHSAKYAVSIVSSIAGNEICRSKPISLAVKMGTAKLTMKSTGTTMFAKDSKDRAVIWFETGDTALNAVEKVEIKDTKYRDLFEIIDYGNGQFAIGYRDETVHESLPGKTITLNLNVFLEGNQTTKANATAKLKLTVVK